MFELRSRHLAQLRDSNTKIGRLAGPNLKDERLKVLMSDSEQIARTTFREKLAGLKKRSFEEKAAQKPQEQARTQQHAATYQQSPAGYSSMEHIQQAPVRQSPHQQMAYSHSNLVDQSNISGSRPASASRNLGAHVTSLPGAQLYGQNQSPYTSQMLYQQLGQPAAAMQQQQPNYGGQLLSPPMQQMQNLYGFQGQQPHIQQHQHNPEQQQQHQQGSMSHTALYQQQAMQLPVSQHMPYQQQQQHQQHQHQHQPRMHQQRPPPQQQQRQPQPRQDNGVPFDFEPRPLEEMGDPNDPRRWM
jgi:hypothetical protein